MAVQERAPASNKDLESIAQARALAVAARQGTVPSGELTQEQIDAIVTAMAEAVTPQAEASRAWLSRKPATASRPTKFRRISFRRVRCTSSSSR
jgi:hypothetical protein